MKAVVKVKLLNGQIPLKVFDKGEFIDLRANETISLTNRGPVTITNIPLGVAMELPKGLMAKVYSRSSTPSKFGVMIANNVGIIDNHYCGNDDEWQCPVLPLRKTTINKGDRIAQFEICLSPKATIWQKIKWLFTSKIEFKYVSNLSNTNRGGFGTTGKN